MLKIQAELNLVQQMIQIDNVAKVMNTLNADVYAVQEFRMMQL
jgi:hypothetical protein